MASTEVARLVAKLEADVRDFDRDLKKADKRLRGLETSTGKVTKGMKQADKGVGKLAGSLKGMVAAVGVAFATKAVFDFAKASVDAAVRLNESVNAVNVTFGEAAEGIKELGRGAAENLGLANSEFNSLAVGFSAFVDKIDAGGGNVVGIMDKLTTRISDFASVMDLEVGEAGNIFRSALAGETEAIRRFGVDVSAATVNAKALALGLKGSSAELTEQDKILARYELIMEQTNKTAGDFANTSDDLANATRRLSAKFTDAKAKIGEALVPALEDMIPLAMDAVAVIADLGLGLGVLTGSIDGVTAAVRRANLGLGEGEDGFDALLKASDNLRKGLVPLKPSDIIDFRRFGDNLGLPGFEIDFVDSITTQTVALLEDFDDLSGAFGITQDNLDRLSGDGFRRAALEMGFTEAALQALIALIEKDVQAEVTKDILNKTQEVRDAVLDGSAAIEGIPDPPGGVAEGFAKIKTEAEKSAEAIQNVQNKLRAMTDPFFAAQQAARDAADSQDALTEAQKKFADDSPEVLEAAEAHIQNTMDLAFAADNLADTMGVDVVKSLQQWGKAAKIPQPIMDALLATADDLEDWEGIPAANLEMSEESKANFERMMALNDIPDFDVDAELVYEERNAEALNRFLLINDTSATAILNYEERNAAALARFQSINSSSSFAPADTVRRSSRNTPDTNVFFGAKGGMVPGPIGAAVPAVLHGGEQVLTPAQQSAGGQVNIYQTFERVEGDHIDEDIQMGTLMAEVGRFAEKVVG